MRSLLWKRRASCADVAFRGKGKEPTKCSRSLAFGMAQFVVSRPADGCRLFLGSTSTHTLGAAIVAGILASFATRSRWHNHALAYRTIIQKIGDDRNRLRDLVHAMLCRGAARVTQKKVFLFTYVSLIRKRNSN